jgi:hypothetical protein
VLEITNREPRARRGRLALAIVCGVGAASLVVYLAALKLTMQSAFAWLALFGLFEVVFAVTVTLIFTWGHEDAFARARPRRRHQMTRRTYVDV